MISKISKLILKSQCPVCFGCGKNKKIFANINYFALCLDCFNNQELVNEVIMTSHYSTTSIINHENNINTTNVVMEHTSNHITGRIGSFDTGQVTFFSITSI